MDEYTKKVIDNFKNPKNVGEIKNPSGRPAMTRNGELSGKRGSSLHWKEKMKKKTTTITQGRGTTAGINRA